MDVVWQELPFELLQAEIIPRMGPADIVALFQDSINDAELCKRLLLPASKFFYRHVPELVECVAMAALTHIYARAELDEFFKTGYAFPMLCSLSNANTDEFLKCVLKRGDISILLEAVDGCSCCISYAFDFLTDYGYVAEFRSMAWTYGLNMKTIFQALYNGNRVILQEIHNCLAVSPSTFVPNLVENMRYYQSLAETHSYDAIPYILELSYQLMDATKRRWLGKQLRLLAKALKTKWLISFVKDFYHNQLSNEEHENEYDFDDY